MNYFFWLFVVLFVVVSLFMILLILIQKGRGGGLSSAFGGGGGNTAFGSKTGDVLTWTTSVVFGIFFLLAIGVNLLANHRQEVSDQDAANRNTKKIADMKREQEERMRQQEDWQRAMRQPPQALPPAIAPSTRAAETLAPAPIAVPTTAPSEAAPAPAMVMPPAPAAVAPTAALTTAPTTQP